MISVGIVGASGFTGAELLRLCAGHPEFNVSVATGESQAGTAVRHLYPNLAAAYPDLRFTPYDPAALDGVDLVFLGLPHGRSQKIAPDLLDGTRVVVDLGADFRLQDPTLYPAWYGEEHQRPDLLDRFVYGLPELFRDEIRQARAIAAPGCYVTASLLALAPLVRAGAVAATGIVVDAASGVSGAGRPPKPNTTFCAADEDFTAYALGTHRHTPEIEQALTRLTGGAGTGDGGPAQVLFTPHLAPMNRGILSTCYARPVGPAAQATTDDLQAMLREAWADEPFVVVTDGSPSTKATQGSNAVHVSVVADARTGWVIALAALDNLVKGASGQAVQCANLALGLPEDTGLSVAGVFP